MSVQFYNVKKNDVKKKSFISKMSGYSSILNANGGAPDQNLQILRISLKKEMDRRDKLERLLQKYEEIQVQEKSHIKSIKAAIIELKDLQSHTKTRFFVDPTIYVDNHLSKQTRQFFCMLLNTFYNKYEVNSQCEQRTKQLGAQINDLLQKISKNQETLLKIEKESIGQQVHLQGQLLGQKNRLKDQIQRMKELQEQHNRIADICSGYQSRYNQQLQKVTKLRNFAKNIEKNIKQLKMQVNQGQLVKQGKQQMMAGQINYQQKFQNQLQQLDCNIAEQKLRFSSLKQYILIKLQEDKIKANEYIENEGDQDIQRKYRPLDKCKDRVAEKGGLFKVNEGKKTTLKHRLIKILLMQKT